MKPDELRSLIIRVLGEVAPDADLSTIRDDLPLREQFDLDSMDLLNFVIGLHQACGVDIPEAEYGRLSTLADAMSYLEPKLQR